MPNSFAWLAYACLALRPLPHSFNLQPAAVRQPTSQLSAPESHASFRVRVVGQGRPLLLLAGLGCSGTVWDQTLARYARRYQCHVVSLAGFAGQAPVAGPLLATARQELLAYVAQQRLHRPALLGHSLGGFLALELATAAPTQFSQVIVLDALPFGAAAAQPQLTEAQVRQATPSPAALGQQFASLPAAQFAQLQRQLLIPAVADTARLRQLLAERLSSDPAALGRATAEMLQTDLRPQLPRLAIPVLVLGSDATARLLLQKPTASAAECRQAYAAQYAAVPHLTLEMHPTARHFLQYDAPEWYFQQLDHVLNAPVASLSQHPARPQ
ncbi:alpha/beta fold hydrolase [Hymenobacter baengnokdamensis]|uniref:alpha/beta fold hydrolase n=1 Tax=Hymenobacter baengnokdamensis TaxID=2615203 RepID=UPI001246138E|nr:alpha/beta hydrolase [Hymenobacter baengnokdamensis]